MAFPKDQRTFTLQLRDELRRLIVDDGLEPGARLPSETELVERFGVSRATVRETLKLLEQDGLIEVVHGRGRFVSPIASLLIDRPVTRYESVTEMLESLGYRPTTRVLSAVLAEASAEEAVALGLERGAQVVRVERLRTQDDEVLVYSLNAFDAELLEGSEPTPESFTGSLNRWLAERGRAPCSSAAQIRAVRLPGDAAKKAGVDGSRPWLMIAERCVDDTGAPVLFSRDYHRGDLFAFHVLRRGDT